MFIGSIIAFVFLVIGIVIGLAIGSAAILLSNKEESKFVGKSTPEATVEPAPEFIPEIEAPGPELTAEPPKSPDITQMNVTLDPGFPVEEYIEMWFDQNFDVERRQN